MIEGFICLILELIARLVITWILLPVVWLLAAPVLLLKEAFAHRPYLEALSDSYRRLTRFWLRWEHLFP